MSELIIDLKEQKYNVFNIVENDILTLSARNFIYGKNGSGKTSLTHLIKEQHDNEETHNINVFTGIENLLVDDKLNAVVLGQENIEIKKDLDKLEEKLGELTKQKDKLENKLKSLEWKEEYSEIGINKSDEYTNFERLKLEIKDKTDEINEFYRHSAKQIKEKTNPQISKPFYNMTDFKNELNNKNQIEESELFNLLNDLKETPKTEIESVENTIIDFESHYNTVNNLVSKELVETVHIKELQNSPNKQRFAHDGKNLHKPGDTCSFCGNVYTEQRESQLESYFSSSDIKKLQNSITAEHDELEKLRDEINNLIKLDKDLFYSHLHTNVNQYNLAIENKQKEYLTFLDTLDEALKDKQIDLFSKKETLKVQMPDSFTKENSLLKEIISDHNDYSKNFTAEQSLKRDRVRYHHIYLYLEELDYTDSWEGYNVEKAKLELLEKEIASKENQLQTKISNIIGDENQPNPGTVNYLNNQIKRMNEEKENLIKDSKNTTVLAQTINDKLNSYGKKDIKLEVIINEDNEEIEHYMIKDNQGDIRDISKLSTGEKNIIAFLYFIGKVKSDVENNETMKNIIIFDDPMTSNDDTMQYLIITELQKLYRGSNKIFNYEKDIFVCMTHNVHFYLNLPPQGNFKDSNGKTKYDKNKFYWLSNGIFKPITNEKEDILTHYEGLWFELRELYDLNHLNTMLNSMRRIIETYTHFNKINPMKFYKDKDSHKKIFDVNSHSIDDLSADIIGKNKDELLEMFKDLFSENDAESHFDNYWR